MPPKYSVHPGVEDNQRWIATLKEKSGRSLPEWIAFIKNVCVTPLLKAGKSKIPKRLIDTGGFAKRDRITHRIEIKTEADIDDFVRDWAQRAYELNA
jgi:hypothetical protein